MTATTAMVTATLVTTGRAETARAGDGVSGSRELAS
jgi:hypothetical protein